MAVLVALAAAGALPGGARPAAAHQTSIKYVDVTVEGSRAAVRLTIAPGDATEPLGLPADATPGVAEAATPAVAGHVAGWLGVGPDGGAPCPVTGPRAAPDADGKFVVVTWEVGCGAALVRLALDFRGFFAVDQRHEAIVLVHAPGQAGDATVVRAAEPVLRVAVGGALGIAGWIASGVEHIAEGRDHVCFVIALLLVVVLVRERGGWATRPPVPTLRRTAAIVTAFTVAHSISLIAAALGWIRLPGQLVESLIAFSILYTAIENILRPDVRWRFALTFGFGLIHGLGFASVLEALLPPDRVLGPLLGFNLGVEIGQLLIVVAVLPVIWLGSRWASADRYRRVAMPIVSAGIGVIAIKWLIERALGLDLGAFWGM